MRRVYYLPVERSNNADRIVGGELISNAICRCTEDPLVRRVVIEEDPELAKLALRIEEPGERDLLDVAALSEAAPRRDLAAEIDDLKARVARLEAS